MKTKFTMFRRGAMFYMQDSATGKQTSLRTKDEAEAILHGGGCPRIGRTPDVDGLRGLRNLATEKGRFPV
jgi:hypothetical protein